MLNQKEKDDAKEIMENCNLKTILDEGVDEETKDGRDWMNLEEMEEDTNEEMCSLFDTKHVTKRYSI